MTIAELTEVWSPLSALTAIVSGVVFGLLVGWVATNPTYSAGIARPLRIAFTSALFALSAGLSFYAGQALGSYLSHDPLWFRVMSRYGQWILFSAAIGVTTWILTRHDRSARRRRAHGRAISELRTPYDGRGDH